jgi:CheY-like chemotaxis protein
LASLLNDLCAGSSAEIPVPSKEKHGWPGRQVLVVDDHPVTRLVAREMLTQLGISVHVAHDGHEALRLIETHHFDLALVDIRMPGCDGPSLARLVRSQEHKRRQVSELKHKPLTMVAFSATTNDGERAAAVEAGMNGWIIKPIRPSELFATLENHLGAPENLP